MRWFDRFRIRAGKQQSTEGSHEQQALTSIIKGNALEDAGALEQAMQFYETAILLAPGLARAHLSRGNVLLATGNAEEALASYATALVHSPDYAAAHYNSGNAHLYLDRREEALISYTRAIELKPDFADAHLAIGCVLEDLNRFEEAELCYRRALDVQPNYAEVHSNLGNALNEMGRFDDAVASHRRALELKPLFADAHSNLGHALDELGRFEEAIASFQRALELKPDFADAHYTLGSALMAAGKASEAAMQYRRAIELDQLHSNARWAQAMALIPPIYDKAKDVEESRGGFARAVAELDVWFTQSRATLGAKAVGSKQPFFLAYQARDNRPLLEPYGRLCARLMSSETGPMQMPFPASPMFARKIRIGVVSAQVRDHSVWIAITRGWIQHLDPARFEVHVFHLGRYSDEETARARREATDFIDTPRTLSDWVHAIAEAQPDVLIYPEIGMDALTTQLAAQRLAPVQATSWGHPQTTGLPTIDIFISSELFEPPQGDAHYSEKLVRLPNLGVCVEPLSPRIAVPDLGAIGLPVNEPLLLCPGVPFKYSPEDDGVWVALGLRLQAHGKGRLVFFSGHRSGMTQQFEQRLRRAFSQAGADFDRSVCLIPTLPRDQFYGLMQHATLMLDTIGFSGFNTALQGLECGLPLVAYEGEFMRGRLASGLLRRMGLDDWVAGSHTEYIEMAMRLVSDEPARHALSHQIAQRRMQLFHDMEPVRALEQVLVDAVAQSSVTTLK
jgi:protein O-GlcNAc transferase